MIKSKMILNLQGYWAVGSGKGGGNEVDSRIDRDADGLPYVPGKMLKGLIRDACFRLQEAGNADYNFADKIFGESGKIFISDAKLSPALRNALSEESNKDAKDNLTRNIYSTAILYETGTAENKSLRGYEVAVPMQLTADVECDCDADTFNRIKIAAEKLIYAVGSHKTRGLGEVIISFEDIKEA